MLHICDLIDCGVFLIPTTRWWQGKTTGLTCSALHMVRRYFAKSRFMMLLWGWGREKSPGIRPTVDLLSDNLIVGDILLLRLWSNKFFDILC